MTDRPQATATVLIDDARTRVTRFDFAPRSFELQVVGEVSRLRVHTGSIVPGSLEPTPLGEGRYRFGPVTHGSFVEVAALTPEQQSIAKLICLDLD